MPNSISRFFPQIISLKKCIWILARKLLSWISCLTSFTLKNLKKKNPEKIRQNEWRHTKSSLCPHLISRIFLPEMWTSLVQFFIIRRIFRSPRRSGIMTIQTIFLICVIRSEPTSPIPNASRVSLNSTWDQNQAEQPKWHDHVCLKSQKRLRQSQFYQRKILLTSEKICCHTSIWHDFSGNFWHQDFDEIFEFWETNLLMLSLQGC